MHKSKYLMQYNFDEIINRENTGCVKYDYRKAVFGTEDVLPMWVADMDFKTPDFITQAVQERARHEIYGYSIQGASYNDAITQWCLQQYDWQVQSSWLRFSPGVVAGLGISVLVFSQPGDKIILQSPVYPPFFTAIQNNGRQVVNNQLVEENGQYKIDFDLLRKQIDSRTKMIFLCNPHNPVGRVWHKEELAMLAEICLENDILIVSDDIHADLVFSPNQYIPIATLSPQIAQNTITFISPSKTFNMAGLFSSVAIIPNQQLKLDFQNKLNDLHMGFPNVFGISALEAAYRHGKSWLSQMLSYTQANIDFAIEYIYQNIPGVRCSTPEGTYLLWLDFRELHLPDKELKQLLIKEAKVGLNDGPSFGPGGNGFQRMNLASPKSIVEEGLRRIAQALK